MDLATLFAGLALFFIVFPSVAPWLRFGAVKLFCLAFIFRRHRQEVPMSWIHWEEYMSGERIPDIRPPSRHPSLETRVLRDMEDNWQIVMPTELLQDEDFTYRYSDKPVLIREATPTKLYVLNPFSGQREEWAQEAMIRRNRNQLQKYLDQADIPDKAGKLFPAPSLDFGGFSRRGGPSRLGEEGGG